MASGIATGPDHGSGLFSEPYCASHLSEIASGQYESCRGIRVFYYEGPRDGSLPPCPADNHTPLHFVSDHKHNDTWTKCLEELRPEWDKQLLTTVHEYVETGTIVHCWRDPVNKSVCLEVRWDCGTQKNYSQNQKEWKNIHVLDIGPAGYRAPIVLCDICLEPVTAFSFRCTNKLCSKQLEDVYDLCCKHYNQDSHTEDELKDHQFQCIMQTKFTFDIERSKLPSRKTSSKSRLIGLYPGAL